MGGLRTSPSGSTGTLSFAGASASQPLQRPTGAGSSAAARQFVDSYGPAFGVATPTRDLTEFRSFHGAAGDAVRYQQTYQGVPVIGGEIAVQLAPTGAVVSTTGRAAVGLQLGVKPVVAAADAIVQARALTAKTDHVDPATLTVDTPVLSIYDPSLWGNTDLAGQRLVWRTAVRTATGDVDRYVLIDASTGAVTIDFSQVEAALNRQVCDQANTVDPNLEPCITPLRSEGQAATGNVDVDGAYDMAKVTYDFYKNVLGRDSIDGNGLALKSTVRVCFQPPPPLQNCPYGTRSGTV